MNWRDKEPTKKQLDLIRDIEDYSPYMPPKFKGTTRGEAADYIDKHVKDAFTSTWAIENGYAD